ncbi:RibD domain-containing protein [Nonomuraea fuscirosea]|uniref:RibD domain-containing protein n=1 Tax=Nonomuraea fuscirosea TaxID=1291556 RepID=A0A2T0LJW5_9ACTN|nr:dihydrofolate reductase family protein [Nonomuraea fuscirosea]PRX42834.1 RibD domain-containing protein [Nonomuraea fuscirosea]
MTRSAPGQDQLDNDVAGEDLIDEFALLTYPIVVGAGKRLFNSGTPLRRQLAETTTSDTGVVISTYHRTGSDFTS